MIQAIVGNNYEIVIPKEIRAKLKWLKPGVKVLLKVIDKNTIHITQAPL